MAHHFELSDTILLFDEANLKQLVFKNKKCQRFFLQLF